jgi:resuscitation-promoting factor RpfA
MADESPEANEQVSPVPKIKKGKLDTSKNKWYIVGGLGVVAVLVFFFVSKSGSSSSNTAATGASNIDPATGYPTGSAADLAALNSAGGLASTSSGSGDDGSTADIGATGQTGAVGATGPAGPAGPTGAAGAPGKAAAPVKAPAKPPAKPPAKSTAGGSYTVKPGDSLSKIAAQFKVSGGWEALYKLNQHTIGANPNLIHPGQKLTL